MIQTLKSFDVSFLLANFTSDDQTNDRIVHRVERYSASIFLQKLKDQICQKQKVQDDKNTLLGDTGKRVEKLMILIKTGMKKSINCSQIKT